MHNQSKRVSSHRRLGVVATDCKDMHVLTTLVGHGLRALTGEWAARRGASPEEFTSFDFWHANEGTTLTVEGIFAGLPCEVTLRLHSDEEHATLGRMSVAFDAVSTGDVAALRRLLAHVLSPLGTVWVYDAGADREPQRLEGPNATLAELIVQGLLAAGALDRLVEAWRHGRVRAARSFEEVFGFDEVAWEQLRGRSDLRKVLRTAPMRAMPKELVDWLAGHDEASAVVKP